VVVLAVVATFALEAAVRLAATVLLDVVADVADKLDADTVEPALAADVSFTAM
jgi:hypothetical protein